MLGGGVRKSKGVPEHKSYESKNAIHERQGDKISESLYSPQKLWTLLHVPRAPFYRETKGLLYSEITLESKEYS
jgi:hypothetical protein